MSVELQIRPVSLADMPPLEVAIKSDGTSEADIYAPSKDQQNATDASLPLLSLALGPMLQRFVDAATAHTDQSHSTTAVRENLLFSLIDKKIVRTSDVINGTTHVLNGTIVVNPKPEGGYKIDLTGPRPSQQEHIMPRNVVPIRGETTPRSYIPNPFSSVLTVGLAPNRPA